MRVEHLVPDELWKAVEPWLPRERLMPKGGRPRMPDRTALMGIVYVARLGVRWRDVRGR
jgi:transposase